MGIPLPAGPEQLGLELRQPIEQIRCKWTRAVRSRIAQGQLYLQFKRLKVKYRLRLWKQKQSPAAQRGADATDTD